jgi:transposase
MRIVRRDIHAVKMCRHCSTTWNRDLNAARNIGHIFERIRESGVRPEVFRPRRRGTTNGRGRAAASGVPLRMQ